ncbi:hypothetical protein GC173_17170 [bacterium]|nr:hypothetical protein [bacterium]
MKTSSPAKKSDVVKHRTAKPKNSSPCRKATAMKARAASSRAVRKSSRASETSVDNSKSTPPQDSPVLAVVSASCTLDTIPNPVYASNRRVLPLETIRKIAGAGFKVLPDDSTRQLYLDSIEDWLCLAVEPLPRAALLDLLVYRSLLLTTEPSACKRSTPRVAQRWVVRRVILGALDGQDGEKEACLWRGLERRAARPDVLGAMMAALRGTNDEGDVDLLARCLARFAPFADAGSLPQLVESRREWIQLQGVMDGCVDTDALEALEELRKAINGRVPPPYIRERFVAAD